jgi:hypothetical protein
MISDFMWGDRPKKHVVLKAVSAEVQVSMQARECGSFRDHRPAEGTGRAACEPRERLRDMPLLERLTMRNSTTERFRVGQASSAHRKFKFMRGTS